jgi:hypothetical protein
VGVAGGQLHAQAHVLEHLHDEEAVDYLDDMLGHPLRDPHGEEIPEDFVHLVPGNEVNASLLRQGHRGVITRIEPAAAASGLRAGMEVSVGPRSDDNRVWKLRTTDGREFALGHAAADAVTVRLLSKA